MATPLVQGPVKPVYFVDPDGIPRGDEDQPIYVQGDATHPIYVYTSITSPLYVSATDQWTLHEIDDATVDSSSKYFAVPSNTEWQVLFAHVTLTTTGTAGNRQLAFYAYNPFGQEIVDIVVGVTQAASLTYTYMFGPSLPDLTAVRATTHVLTPIPPTILLWEQCNIRIWDIAAIAPAADDMIVRIIVARRSV